MALRATPEDEKGWHLTRGMHVVKNRIHEEKWPFKKWWKPPR
jgi:hypothetical protein